MLMILKMSDGDVMTMMMMMIYDDDTLNEKLTVNFQLDRLGHRLWTEAIVGKTSVHSTLQSNNQFLKSKTPPLRATIKF